MKLFRKEEYSKHGKWNKIKYIPSNNQFNNIFD